VQLVVCKHKEVCTCRNAGCIFLGCIYLALLVYIIFTAVSAAPWVAVHTYSTYGKLNHGLHNSGLDNAFQHQRGACCMRLPCWLTAGATAGLHPMQQAHASCFAALTAAAAGLLMSGNM
jgi:hypothetical protein